MTKWALLGGVACLVVGFGLAWMWWVRDPIVVHDLLRTVYLAPERHLYHEGKCDRLPKDSSIVVPVKFHELSPGMAPCPDCTKEVMAKPDKPLLGWSAVGLLSLGVVLTGYGVWPRRCPRCGSRRMGGFCGQCGLRL